MEVKEKFLPITQYIKPTTLEKNEMKKEKKKMRIRTEIGTCPDCGQENIKLTSQGICIICRTRKTSCKMRGVEYVPYLKLSEKERIHIDNIRNGIKKRQQEKEKEFMKEIPIPNMQIAENYYQVKAENNPTIAVTEPKNIEKPAVDNDSLTTKNTTNQTQVQTRDIESFVDTLKECGCEISEETLSEVLNVLLATDTMKDVIMTIVKNKNQQALLDLEQMLNVAERKLQHIWEYNGFREEDDKKFKEFLTWRRILKGSMFFWKKLYQSNTLIEMQRAWNAYTADPSEKITLTCDKERVTSALKRFQITTETISTILNTRREFTRVFYATSETDAHERFVKWLEERQLHENPSKTKIVELSNEGERM